MKSRVLITGGAGFVGSSLALSFKHAHPDWEIIALDNLNRRGSELALARLRNGGVIFRHGDVRCPDDLYAVGSVDLLIDCSAEPSVNAGYDGAPNYLIDTNLVGTLRCLEFLRRNGGRLIFLSTSRVYPIRDLRALPLRECGDRLWLEDGVAGKGWSPNGITEDFSLEGSRSLYGATKLCSELIIQEYRALYGVKAIVNRCGVITGPWQMGKVDQGFVALWVARHLYGGKLKYIGFGGTGMQVRDVLHVDDLYDLLDTQLEDFDKHSGRTYNVGGGVSLSVSLRELTALCQRITKTAIEIGSETVTHGADVPYYVSDCTLLQQATGWRPRRNIETILDGITEWLRNYRRELVGILC